MRRPLLYSLLLFVLLLGCILAGLQLGAYDTDLSQTLESILHYDANNPVHFAIWQLRMPRLLLAILTGASLAFCGYLMQAMVNNALADPYLLGTASGASLGAASCFVFFADLTFLGIYLPPIGALLGSFGVTLIVVLLGYRKGQLIPAQLLLAGVAVSSMMLSLLGLLTFLASSEGALRSVVFWTMGGFERADWATLIYPAGALAVGLLIFLFAQKHLNILLLGAERAKTLGVNVVRIRWLILLTISIVTGFAVALSGPVGFVGLIIPHVTRSLLGISGRFNLLFCAFAGGLFMLLCDILARVLYPPAGLPIGIITALFGVPFFVYLLLKKNYRFT